MLLFDKFENRYIIKGIITNLNPIHIGAGGASFNPLEVDNRIVRYASTNEPYIPGSSLKGVLRSFFEQIYPKEHCWATINPCSKKKEKEIEDKRKKYSENPEGYAKEVYSLLCDICKVFGSQETASKIYISDLKVREENGKKLYKLGVRDGVGIDRDTGTAANRMKYDFEVIEPGAKFDLYMVFENLENEYVKSFLIPIVEVLKSGELKIGGKTSRGLGRIKLLEDFKIYKITKDNIKNYLEKGLNEIEPLSWADFKKQFE
ncbi:CRISPR-associated RAMP protein Csx7 [Caldicellulosiruptor acetigenus]|uniref:CRISPR-associated RAMP protein, SSO1426 family n=1 Tax=Caldicellulosiruptor acetigenus 6A TaxID=632516 RepID=G2PYR0_9FIRM|nr:CRISPR-associated RAMP protein Csx7 [Caldicellulosiruptor acetigenus]AEM74979.1 CRISPR-associated RAMP protein, SSO1426 family [Caldicellulosiruptor acetigenus 6A]